MAVDTDELINSAIESRAVLQEQRQSLATRRAQIVRQLASTPGGKRNRGQIASLQAELSGLSATERNLGAQERAIQQESALRAHSAFRNAHLATQAAKNLRDEQTATHVANVQSGVAQLEAKYPNRTFDSSQAAKFNDELNKLTTENPLYSRNASASAAVRQAHEFHQQELGKAINKAATEISGLGVNPVEFLNRDRSKDFLTNADKLPQAGDKTAQADFQSKRADAGTFAHFQVGNREFLVKADKFQHWNGLLAPQPVGQSAPVEGEQSSYVAPTPPPQGTTYAISGTNQPAHAGDYWTQQLPGGLVQKNFASGGSATVTDTSTPEGAAATAAAQSQTAARKQYLEQNPSAGTFADTGTQVAGQPNFPANLTPTDTSPTGARNDTRTATLPAGVQPNQPNPDAYLSQQPTESIPGLATQTVTPTVTPVTQPAPQVNPQMALAQKALNDPTATEEHKAAARKILGLE